MLVMQRNNLRDAAPEFFRAAASQTFALRVIPHLTFSCQFNDLCVICGA